MTDLPRPVVAIPLADAAICLSCTQEAIFYLPGSARCPSCASEHFVMVEKIIGSIRPTNDEAADPGRPTASIQERS
jgi:hypothetical protein